MSEMVERVARAIDPHSFALFEAGGPNREWDASACEVARERARVAIAAMREPTEAMLLAAERAEELGDAPAYKQWRAMIDAALA